MREFGDVAGDPVLEFCEDWMLADEVTHVKMGSDWLRRLTEDDPERRAQALEFQRVVDKLFSLGGVRGEDEDSPIKLARRFRELAGFADDEIDEIAELSHEARQEMARAAASARSAAQGSLTDGHRHARDLHHGAVRPRRHRRPPPTRSPPPSASRPTRTLRVEVDEANPLARTHLLSIDPVVLAVDGGAFEDPRHPRQLEHRRRWRWWSAGCSCRPSTAATRPSAIRRPTTPCPCPTGWPGTSTPLGRLGPLGYPAQRQRRLYNFRNRHGFTDAADAAFDAAVDRRGPHLGRHRAACPTAAAAARPADRVEADLRRDRLRPGRGR